MIRRSMARTSVSPPTPALVSGSLVEERRTSNLTLTACHLELGWSTAITPASMLLFGVARAFDAVHVRGAIDTAAFLNLSIR